jgi:hypothetical protein
MTSLPTINRPIDNTALSAFMTCPREYKLAMIEGWATKEKHQALSYGSFWHKLLEVHYQTGGDQQKVLKAFTEGASSVPDDGDYRTSKRAWLDYQKYIKKYPSKLDCAETVGFPDAPMVEISTAIHNEKFGHEYAGKIDRIIMSNGLGYIEDHKTTSRLDKHYFSQYENSNQMMGYVWIAQQLVPGIRIAGVRINLAHVLTKKTEFERHTVTYSEARMKEWERNTGSWLRRLKFSIENDDFPGHFGDNGCSRKFGKCQFFKVCSTSETIRQKYLEQEFVVRHWDPLATEHE